MEQRIFEIVKKEFEANVLEIKRIIEGYSHYMYEVKTDKSPEIIIIRFSNNIKNTCNLGKEKYIIDLLRQNNIPAPRILAFYFPKDKKEEGYMILEKIKGIRLDTIWNSLDKEEKRKITKKIGEFLSKIHQIKLKEFGAI